MTEQISECIKFIMDNYETNKKQFENQAPKGPLSLKFETISKKIVNHYPNEMEYHIYNQNNTFCKQNYYSKYGVGLGGWAGIPWIGIFHRTAEPTQGINMGFLFSEDMQNIYLIIGQGTENEYASVEDLVRIRDFIRNNYAVSSEFRNDNKLWLADTKKGKYYKESTIFYKEYSIDSLQSDDELFYDLDNCFKLYKKIIEDNNHSAIISKKIANELSNKPSFEDFKKMIK